MSSSLDMSLEDLIKNSKNATGRSAGRGRGRGAGSGTGPGPTRRFSNRGGSRSTPYDKPVQAPDTMWKHDMYTDQVAAFSAPGGRASSIETGTKLYISNLEYGVSNEDIKELFSEVGDLKRYSIHYDRSGRSKGTAEVVFSRRTDALSAVKRYNGVQLDGKPMNIEIVGTNTMTPASQAPVVNGLYGQLAKSGGQRTRSAHGQARGGGNNSRGRGRAGFRGGSSSSGRGRSRTEPVSAEDLDADLDKYHSEAMQTN